MIYVALSARWIVAVVLVVAGCAKLGDGQRLGETVVRYDVLPKRLVRPFAQALPAVEILMGIGVAMGLWLRASAVVAAVVFAGFALAIGRSLRRGERFDCGCGLGSGESLTSWWHVGRSVALALLAVVAGLGPTSLALGRPLASGAPSAGTLIAVPLTVVLVAAALRLIGPTVDLARMYRRGGRTSIEAAGSAVAGR